MGRGFAITEYTWHGCACVYRVARPQHNEPWSAVYTWSDGRTSCSGAVVQAYFAHPTSAQSACYRHDRECEAVQAALTFGVRWIREGEMLARDRKGGV